MLLAASCSPLRLGDLMTASDSEGIGGNLARDAGAGTNVSTVADGHGGDQSAVTADEGTGTDGCWMLALAIVVASDDAGADVGSCADGGIAQIAEMASLGARPEARFLHLDEVADVGLGIDLAAGAQVDKGADGGGIGDGGVTDDAVVTQQDALTDDDVFQHTSAAHQAAGADAGAAEKLDPGLDHGAGCDLHVGRKNTRLRTEEDGAGCLEASNGVGLLGVLLEDGLERRKEICGLRLGGLGWGGHERDSSYPEAKLRRDESQTLQAV